MLPVLFQKVGEAARACHLHRAEYMLALTHQPRCQARGCWVDVLVHTRFEPPASFPESVKSCLESAVLGRAPGRGAAADVIVISTQLGVDVSRNASHE